MNNRVQKLRNGFSEQGVDAVIISGSYNRRYLSGFTGSAGYLYISRSKAVLLTDFRYLEQGAEQCPGFEIVDARKLGLFATVSKYFAEEKIESCGLEGNQMTYAEYDSFLNEWKEMQWKNIGDMVERLRMIKSEEELILLRRASQIGDEAFTYILGFIKPGYTEKEIGLELEYAMRRLGAESNSFSPIIASGTNGALPHARPSDKKIVKGELLTLDFGCIYQGYCSDMTRTVAVGEVDSKLKEIYEVTYRAHMEALNALRPGVAGKEIDAIARKVIADAGYGEYFGHGLGHSVGLEVHESPMLNHAEERILQVNMLETIEPGIYIPGLGGVRIEDLALITENGAETLVTSEKKLIVL